MKKSLKRAIICFFLILGIAGTISAPTEAKSQVNYTKIYKKFAEKQMRKRRKLYTWQLWSWIHRCCWLQIVYGILETIGMEQRMRHIYINIIKGKLDILDILVLDQVQDFVIIKNLWFMVVIIFLVDWKWKMG